MDYRFHDKAEGHSFRFVLNVGLGRHVVYSALLGRGRPATRRLAVGANEPAPDTRDNRQDASRVFDLRAMFAQ